MSLSSVIDSQLGLDAPSNGQESQEQGNQHGRSCACQSKQQSEESQQVDLQDYSQFALNNTVPNQLDNKSQWQGDQIPVPQSLVDRYEPIKPLGSGCFATTFQCVSKGLVDEWGKAITERGQVVCVKVARVVIGRAHVASEIETLQSLTPHPLIINLVDIDPDWQVNPHWMVVPYVDGFTLADTHLHYNQGIPPTLIWHICVQLLEAVSFLHNHQPAIAHSDLQDANIMLDTSNCDGNTWPNVRLIDFGNASIQSSTYGDRSEYLRFAQGAAYDVWNIATHIHRLAHIPSIPWPARVYTEGKGLTWSCTCSPQYGEFSQADFDFKFLMQVLTGNCTPDLRGDSWHPILWSAINRRDEDR